MVLTARPLSRREELVEVALVVLERDGAANLSIGEIARLAEIKPPSLYKQFTSKADIEAGLIEHGFRLLAADLRAATPGSAGTRDRVARFARCLRAFGHEHPQLYQLMSGRPYPADMVSPEAEQAAGAGYRELVSDSAIAQGAWAWAHGLLMLEIAGRLPAEGDAPWDLLVDTLSALEEPAG